MENGMNLPKLARFTYLPMAGQPMTMIVDFDVEADMMTVKANEIVARTPLISVETITTIDTEDCDELYEIEERRSAMMDRVKAAVSRMRNAL